jgi:hypothetical protein
MQWGIGLGVLCVATLGGGLRAQMAAEFGGLKPGQVVRVHIEGRSRFETRLGGGAGDTPSTLFAGAEIPFTTSEVDSLWVRGHATWTGAIVGAAVLTPLSFLWWGLVCEALSEGLGCEEWGTVTVLSLAGGAAGALIGAGVGALIPKWRLRYARGGTVTIAPMVAPGRVGLAVRF